MDTLKAEIVIPDWVNWIAVDKDGAVFGFAVEPACRSSVWDYAEADEWDLDCAEIYKGKPPKNWKDELYTWG